MTTEPKSAEVKPDLETILSPMAHPMRRKSDFYPHSCPICMERERLIRRMVQRSAPLMESKPFPIDAEAERMLTEKPDAGSSGNRVFTTLIVFALLLLIMAWSIAANAQEAFDPNPYDHKHSAERMSRANPKLSPLQNEPRDNDSLSYSGYLSQGWVLSRPSGEQPTLLTRTTGRKTGSLTQFQAGMYASYNISPNIDVRGGGRVDISGSGITPRIMFGLVDIHTNSTGDSSMGIRLGRVKNFYGYHNATRDNAAARDLDYPSQALYREAFKALSTSGDGIQLYAETKNAWGSWTIELTAARPILKPQAEIVNGFFGYPARGYYESRGIGLLGTSLEWVSPGYRWGAYYSRNSLDLTYNPSADDQIKVNRGSMDSVLHTVGVRKYFDDWDLTFEALFIEQNGTVWDQLQPNPNNKRFKPFGGSVEARYHATANLTYYVGYNVWHNNFYDRRGMGNNLGLPAHRFYSQDVNVGFKWSFHDDWILRSELHHVKGTSTLPIVSNPNLPADRGRYWFISASITYRF